MKFTVVVLFVAFCSAIGVDSESASESSDKITGHRSPIISGDTIALRSAYTSGVYSMKWLECTKGSCRWTNCASAIGFKGCSKRMMFIITAKGKKEGHPINSGDTVLLSSVNYGPRYRLSCSYSTSAPCCVKTPTRSIKKGDWLEDSDATFDIFSRDAVDGTPVENRDVVGFKYPYSSNSAWLTFSGRHFYPRKYSSKSKEPCAAENKPTGFVIFKKL